VTFFRRSSTWIHLLLLTLLVLVIYLPTLPYSFVLDDHAGIEKNESIRSLDTVFAQPISMFRSVLLHISYSFGQLEPSYYRIMNIVFHLGTVYASYVLLSLVAVPIVGLFVALLFAVHPILTESVVWISSLTYPQYSFFLLCSLIFYILRKRATKKLKYTVLFFISFVLSAMSSEKALVLPLLILLYEWLFGSIKKNWKVIAVTSFLVGCMAVVTLFFLQSRITIFSASAPTGKTELINPLMQFPVVLGTYINLIVWPQRLTIYHLDEAGVPPGALAIYSSFFLSYLIGLFVAYKKDKTIFFFLSFFLIASLPALIPVHVIQIAAERYAYLGTVGLIAGIVLTLFKLVNRGNKKLIIYLYVLLSVCVLLLAWRTAVRTRDWEREMTLRHATLRDAPYSSRAHNNVGIQYMNDGNYEAALEEYKISIRLRPDYSHPYHNIGHMFAIMQKYQEAVPYYKEAQRYNPYEWKTRQDLGQVYFMLKRYPEAKEELKIAIKQGSPEVARLTTILNKIKELGY